MVTIADYSLKNDNREILVNYRENLSQLKIMSADDFKTMRKGFRKDIMRILGEGIPDTFDGTPITRYLLTADEILAGLHKRKVDVKLTTLYYHLQELEKLGCIQIAVELRKADEKRTGRAFKAFYGRTAKIMMLGNSLKLKDELEILKRDDVKTFLSEISGKSTAEINSIISKILEIENHPVDEIVRWLNRHGERMYELDFSVGGFLNLMFFLKVHDRTIAEGITEFRELLGLQ